MSSHRSGGPQRNPTANYMKAFYVIVAAVIILALIGTYGPHH